MVCTGFAHASGWYDVGKVTRVHTGHENAGVAYFSTEIQINSVCPAQQSGYAYSTDDSNGILIYSELLTSYVKKLPISIYVTDQCLASRPQVNAVQFRDAGVGL